MLVMFALFRLFLIYVKLRIRCGMFVIRDFKKWRGTGGREPGRTGAGGVRETGEERAGSGISMMAGSGREIPKGKLSLIVTAHHPVKETNPTTFLDFHLTFSEALNQNFNARKVKKRKFALGIEKRALLPVKLETFPSRLHHRSRVLMNEVA